MRAIIIQDKDAQSLILNLELNRLRFNNVMGAPATTKPEAWTEEAWRQSVIDDLHRSFQFVVVRWLQDQGCDVIRK